VKFVASRFGRAGCVGHASCAGCVGHAYIGVIYLAPSLPVTIYRIS